MKYKGLNKSKRKKGTSFHKKYIKDHAKRNTWKAINKRKHGFYAPGHQSKLF